MSLQHCVLCKLASFDLYLWLDASDALEQIKITGKVAARRI
jgi:hypothetical protein